MFPLTVLREFVKRVSRLDLSTRFRKYVAARVGVAEHARIG